MTSKKTNEILDEIQEKYPVRYRGEMVDYAKFVDVKIPCPHCRHYGAYQFTGTTYDVLECDNCGKDFLVKWRLHHDLFKLKEA